MKPFLSTSVLVLLSAVVSLAQKPASEFTTTDPKKAKVVYDSAKDPEAEIDGFEHHFPGLGGYKVIHEGGDLRSWINLVYARKKTDLMSDTLSRCPGQFPAKANNVVQWRGYRTATGFAPYGIIYRMMSSADDAKQTRLETFIIIKLDGAGSRVVGSLSAREGNEKAEKLADKLCRPR